MNRSHWRFAAGTCAAVLIACTKGQSSNQDTTQVNAQATAPTMTGLPGGVSILGGWPIPDIITGTASVPEVKGGKKIVTVHMDVPVPSISKDLEDAVQAVNGHAVLEIIKDTLVKGTPASWATLKAALRCSHADLANQNTVCTPRQAPSGSAGMWPNPGVSALTDHNPPKVTTLLQIIMEIKVNADSTKTKVEAALAKGDKREVLQYLVDDKAISSNPTQAKKDSVGWATLKAALGCADYLPTEKMCAP